METLENQSAQLKQRVEAEWAGEDTAAAWRKYYPQMKVQFAGVTKALADAANPQPGMKVLDLASGAGEPSLTIARRVAPGGSVVATDFSEAMLGVLRENAANEGVGNITTQFADAHSLDFP